MLMKDRYTSTCQLTNPAKSLLSLQEKMTGGKHRFGGDVKVRHKAGKKKKKTKKNSESHGDLFPL